MVSCLKMNHLYLFIIGALMLLGIDMAAEEIKIYRGDSTSWTNIILTYKDGKLYRGDSTSWTNIVFTYKQNKLYRGDSTSWTNIVMTFSDEFRTGELLGIVFLFFPGDCM